MSLMAGSKAWATMKADFALMSPSVSVRNAECPGSAFIDIMR